MNGRDDNARSSQHNAKQLLSGDWLLGPDEEPPVASHLVTRRTGYNHHGIYVGNGRVVHYAGLSRGLWGGSVEEVSLETFAHGRGVRIRHDPPRFDRSEVVKRARSRLGECSYRLLTNNCEHFCAWALRGESRSTQVERLCRPSRALWNSLCAWVARSKHTRVQSRRLPGTVVAVSAPRMWPGNTMCIMRRAVIRSTKWGITRAASRALAPLLGSLLAACITPPQVSPVQKPVDTRTDLGLGAAPAPAQDAWWTAYQDAQLDRLLEAAVADNPTLGQAQARLRQAQAAVDATRAELWPYISYDFAETRQRFSGTDVIPPPYAGTYQWEGRQGLNFSWELDFWGRQSSLVREARGSANAADLDAAAARLAIVSAVVRTYIDLKRSYELVDVARHEEQQRQEILDITRHRFQAGLDTNVELRQAAGAVPQARVERRTAEAEIARDVHLLAALSGQGAARYGEIQRPGLQMDTVLSVPNALPVDLLSRRPDVLAARSRVSSARAGLAAAKADFYPNINLVAFAGTAAIGLDNLFHSESAALGVGPALHLPVFDAGRLRANYRANTADIDIAVSAYNQTVLTAVQETADQLSDIASLSSSLVDQQRSLDDAEVAFRLANERYNAGLTSYLTVLITETQVLDARRQRVDLETARASARVRLLIDVGGDFRPDTASLAANASH